MLYRLCSKIVLQLVVEPGVLSQVLRLRSKLKFIQTLPYNDYTVFDGTKSDGLPHGLNATEQVDCTMNGFGYKSWSS